MEAKSNKMAKTGYFFIFRNQSLELFSGQLFFCWETEPETAAGTKLLDSLASGDIYRFMHHLRTLCTFYKWKKKFFKCKNNTALVRYFYS